MIIELATIVLITTAGSALIYSTGYSGLLLPVLGFIAGLCLQIIIGFIQVISFLPNTPVLTITLTVTISLSIYFLRNKSLTENYIRFSKILIIIPLTSIFVLITIYLSKEILYIKHVDSMEYLAIGSMLTQGTFSDGISLYQLQKRMLAVPLMHAPANLGNNYFFISITPLIAVSTLFIIFWILYNGLKTNIKNNINIYLYCILGILLLVSNNRFIMHAFYINGHLFFAVLILIIAGCGWLIILNTNISIHTLYFLQSLSIPVIMFTRPESPLIVFLVLLPVILSNQIDLRYRISLILIFGVSVIFWHLFLASLHIQQFNIPPVSILGLLFFGLMAVFSIYLLVYMNLEKISHHILAGIEIGLWLVLLAFIAIKPGIFYDSIIATYYNVISLSGYWGSSVVILGILVVTALVMTDIPGKIFLRFPITTYIPMFFILAYLRGGAYRVGGGDSLNRMLIQVVPLAVLFVAAAASSRHWGLPSWLRKGNRHQTGCGAA